MSAASPNDRLVLCYHAISEAWPATLAVTPARLDEQIDDILSRGYRATTFHDLVFGLEPEKLVALTFDDGFASVFNAAAPILDRHGIPATIFVVTSHVGSAGPMSWPGIENWVGTEYDGELRPISWDQLKELRDRGWEVGSHTRTHPRLPALDDNALDLELISAKQECESALGAACESVSYPYGDHDQRVIDSARRAGYSAGCTLPDRLHPASPLRWPRIGIYNNDDAGRFRHKTSRAVRGLRSTFLWNAVRAVQRAPTQPRAS